MEDTNMQGLIVITAPHGERYVGKVPEQKRSDPAGYIWECWDPVCCVE